MMNWRAILLAPSVALIAACCGSGMKAGQEESPLPGDETKPTTMECDPARPDLPCTPEAAPLEAAPVEEATPPGVKPHFVPCDPAHPELPCTPEPEPPAPEAAPPE